MNDSSAGRSRTSQSCSGLATHMMMAVFAGGYAERTARLFRVANLLKRYADQYKLAVVVTNQVHCLASSGYTSRIPPMSHCSVHPVH